MDSSLGPYRFKYADDGLAIYKLGDLVEQYFLCDEHFWFQVLRVRDKTFKFRVSTHTKEEQRVKIWKKFRGFPRERKLSQAINTLERRDRKDDEDEKDEEPYEMLKKAMETAKIWKQREEMRDQCCCMNLSWWGCSCYCQECSGVDCGGC